MPDHDYAATVWTHDNAQGVIYASSLREVIDRATRGEADELWVVLEYYERTPADRWVTVPDPVLQEFTALTARERRGEREGLFGVVVDGPDGLPRRHSRHLTRDDAERMAHSIPDHLNPIVGVIGELSS